MVTAKTGESIGLFTSGVCDIVTGTLREDKEQQKEGLKDVGKSVVDTATGVARGAVQVLANGAHVLDGVMSQDSQKVKDGCIGLAKTAAIATLAVGVLDAMDVLDVVGDDAAGIESDGEETAHVPSDSMDPIPIPEPTEPSNDVVLVENPNSHSVTPHFRELPDGRTIWVDGDGDTSINTFEGWKQSNPDFRLKA